MTDNNLDTGLTPDEFDLAFDAAASGEPIEPEVPTESQNVLAEPPVTPPAEPAAPPAPPPEKAPQEPPQAAAPQPVPEVIKEPELPPPPTVDEAARALENFTDEEKALFEQVQSDFPDISKLLGAVERKVEAKFKNAFAEEIAKVRQEVAQQFAPALNEAQMSAQQRHNATILKAHPDAFDLAPQVTEWVAKQPGFLQATFKKVLDSGSAAEVVDLLNVFKKGSDIVAVSAPETPKDTEKEDRLAAQEGVTGRRSSRQAAIDPNDYDGAFEKFAATA